VRFASIGSGSDGNGTLIANGCEGTVLLDCGFSTRETLARLADRGLTAADLAGILVTHEHSDHLKGVARLANRFRLPVYSSWGSFSSRLSGELDEKLLQVIEPGTGFQLAGMRIEPVPVPHDAREPCQYVFATADARLGVLTDAGSINRRMLTSYQNCDALMLECNHDLRMLAEGPYPAQLKRRVGGALGHLNNGQAAELLRQVGHSALQHLIVTHISRTNNTPELAVQALLDSQACVADIIQVADQRRGLDWCEIRPRNKAAPAGQLALEF